MKIVVHLGTGIDSPLFRQVSIVQSRDGSGITLSMEPKTGATVRAEIFGICGKLVLQSNFTDETTLENGLLPRGVYILKLSDRERIIIRKFTIW